jgi:predicted CopG family antitoxin
MTEHTTIRVTKDAKEAADKAKKENETWNEYIQRCTEQKPEIVEFVEADPCMDGYVMDGTVEKDGETVPNCVPKEEFTQSVEIDYTELANQTAEEVERRLR